MSSDSALDVARIIATPTCLAQYLAPKIWGPDATYRADPWILALEEAVIPAIRNKDSIDYIKSNAPPQIGKSMWEEVFLAMWVLGMFPDTRIILAAYSDQLAQRSGALCRDLIKAFGPSLFGINIDPEYSSKGDWKLSGHQGGMLSVGIGSSIAGRSADLMLIGDLIKNMQEAGSKALKDLIWDEWHGSLRTRLQPGATVILTATRYADDDLSGRLDQQQNDPSYNGPRWKSFIFKAIAAPADDDPDADDPDWRDIIGRRKGEPLKTRFSKPGDEEPENWENSYFYQLRDEMDPYAYAALYDQDPTASEEGMFPPSGWSYFDPDDPDPALMKVRVWDLAATEGEGDWTVGVLLVRISEEFFDVRDVIRKRLAGAKVKELVEAVAAIDGVEVPVMIEREKSGAGKTILDFYRQSLPFHQVLEAIPDGTKEDRARPYSMLQQRGRIRLPRSYETGESPEWVEAFVDQHRKMMGDGRKGRFDDMIDATAYGINHMLNLSLTTVLDPALLMTSAGKVISRDPSQIFSPA